MFRTTLHHNKALTDFGAGLAFSLPFIAFAWVYAQPATHLYETLALLWLPNGYALGIMPRLRRPGWWAILLAHFLASAFVFGHAEFSAATAVILAGIQTTGIAFAGALLRHFKFLPCEESPANWLYAIVIAAVFVNGMCAMACAFTIGLQAPNAPLAGALPWFLSQLPGYCCFMPLIALWTSGNFLTWIHSHRRQKAALAIVLIGTTLTTWYGFGGASDYVTPAGFVTAPHVVAPFIIGALLMFDARVMALLMAIVMGVGLVRTAGGQGVFAAGNSNVADALLAAGACLSLMAACANVTAAFIAARSREYRRTLGENERREACAEAGGWASYAIAANGTMTWSRNASEVLATGGRTLPNTLEDWLLRIAPAQRDVMSEHYQALLSGKLVGAQEFTLCHATDAEVMCEDIAKPLPVQNSPTHEVVGFIRNATAQKVLEEEIKQARPVVSVGRIAGSIAHDLANVLSIIHGHSQLLAASSVQSGTGKLTSAIMAAAERGRQLCHQILLIARPRALRERVEAAELIHELRTMLIGLARFKVAIETEVEDGDLVVPGNAGRLLQALLNLSINALESIKEDGGVLTIRCFHVSNEAPFPSALGIVNVGSYLCFELTDNGEGIPAHLLSRILEPGYSTKEGDAPRGMGLAIVAFILTEIGAFMDVDSQPGAGTTFRIYVPRPAGATSAPSANVLPPAQFGIGESILIMDLDEENLLSMEDMVADIGLEPNAFSNCEEALRSLAAHARYKAAIIASNATLADGTPFYDAVAKHMPAFKIVLICKNSPAPTTAMSVLMRPFTRSDLGTVLARVLSS